MSGACMDMKTELERTRRERDSLKRQLAEANAELELNTELMRKQDAALAQMREALEFYVEDERELCSTLGCNDCKTGSLANTCRDAKRTGAARTALSADSGKATLERIRNLEAKAARLDYLRPEVLWFAEQMERQLRLHDEAKGKRGWKDLTLLELSALLDDERKELSNALRYGPAENLVHEAADVANIAMMVADNARPRKAGEGK
jgi:hypothetical protein